MYAPAVRLKSPVPMYGETPPLPLTDIVVVPPLHAIEPATAVATNGLGWGILTDAVALQPFPSVINTL